MEILTEEDRASAWDASWHPSFDGRAIVTKDFVFSLVNPQFCEIVGATPAEILGKKFQDITPPRIRELDERNAQLIIDGVIKSYVLSKTYEFGDNRRVDVVLLVTGVYDTEKQFKFFVSRIMKEGDSKEITSPSPLATPSRKLTKLLDFFREYYQILTTIGVVIATAIYTIYIKLLEGATLP